MQTRTHAVLVAAWAVVAAAHNLPAQNATPAADWNLQSAASRSARVQQLRADAVSSRDLAWRRAAAEGWSPKGAGPGFEYELQYIRGDRPYIYHTMNVNAAVSTAANLVRNTVPYSVNGAGRTVGVWDGGSIRTTHQELTGRVTSMDGAAVIDHATHVGGTIGAAGVVASALGMAPSVQIASYDWNSDASEMTSRAMATAGEAGKIQLSNHSYGYLTGWDTSDGTYRWYGTWGEREDAAFGQYDSTAHDWDTLCYNAPFYLPCKAAGNDRNDVAPPTGTVFRYYSKRRWVTKTYDPTTDPYSDGYDNGGFDTIDATGSAKNILTVGAVNDAVSGGVRSTAAATMSTFSCWGPTDDGRVKPDVVGNGVSLYSSVGTSDTSYDTYSGTSMATPNICGSAALLTDYYGRLFPGQFMRASSLKGLIIHTADDLGNAGPDYKFGWGLVNMKAAADLLKSHLDVPSALHLAELALTAATTSRTNAFTWDGSSAIRATLCWTDPAGTALSGLDNRTKALVNDLDLRIIGPTGQIYLPYVLAPLTPSVAATTGDNSVDNVEQVYVASPGTPGTYRAVISLHGSLTGSSQSYSVILSGSSALTHTVTFDGQGGMAPSPASVSVTYGLTYGTLATTTRAGYSFGGWWTGPGGTGSQVTAATTVTITASQTLYAKWTLAVTTQGTPYLWLDQYALVTGGDYESAALSDVDGDGHKAWQEYIAGSIPTNHESILRSLIAVSNGAPWVTWVPDLGTARVYAVDGKTNLTDGAWGTTNAGSRCFRVRVRLP
jgi:uncharacterized repeat protein (TIGR02543 family)